MQACDDALQALAFDDPLRPVMAALLATIRTRMGQADRGRRPAAPDRARFLNKLAPSHPLRPAREAAFTAMDNLLAIAWLPATSTERSQKKRNRPDDADDGPAPDLTQMLGIGKEALELIRRVDSGKMSPEEVHCANMALLRALPQQQVEEKMRLCEQLRRMCEQ